MENHRNSRKNPRKPLENPRKSSRISRFPFPKPPPSRIAPEIPELRRTHGSRGGDPGRFREHLDDSRPDWGRAPAVGVQVPQELLDHQVGMLGLQEKWECKKSPGNVHPGLSGMQKNPGMFILDSWEC